jgi:hypothetical protein
VLLGIEVPGQTSIDTLQVSFQVHCEDLGVKAMSGGGVKALARCLEKNPRGLKT